MSTPTKTSILNEQYNKALELWPNGDRSQLRPYFNHHVRFLVLLHSPIYDYKNQPVHTDERPHVVMLDDVELPCVQHRVYLMAQSFDEAVEFAKSVVGDERDVNAVSVGVDPYAVSRGVTSLRKVISQSMNLQRCL